MYFSDNDSRDSERKRTKYKKTVVCTLKLTPKLFFNNHLFFKISFLFINTSKIEEKLKHRPFIFKMNVFIKDN